MNSFKINIDGLYYEGYSDLEISRKLSIPILEVKKITDTLRKQASEQ